jgi:hypothetical protein
MNERIQQLAEQATSYADTLDVADQRIYQKIRDREFAELIIKECAEVCLEANDHKNILRHFGIEPDVNENLRNRSTYFGNDI